MNRDYVLGRVSAYQGRYRVLNKRQEVGDIIQGVLRCHNQYKGEYDKIAAGFDAGRVRATAENIWNFLKKNVRYKVESEDRQMLKSPAAIMQPGTSSDCKNFALFSGGILDALKRKGKRINWCYRFASYNILSKTPQHVFVVINPGKDEIWVDPVLNSFDNRKQYYYKIDKYPEMALISLAGVEIGKTKEEKKKKRQQFFKKMAADIKKSGKFVLKFSLVAQRGAILLVMIENLWGIATKTKKALDSGHDKMLDFWEKIGGDKNKFKAAVEKGAKHKYVGAIPAGGLKQMRFSDRSQPKLQPTASGESLPLNDGGEPGEMIGVIPIAAAAATATPFIMKIIDFFKKAGIKGSDITDMAAKFKKAHDDKGKEVEQAINDEAEGKETETGNDIVKQHNKGGGIPKVALIGGAALLGAYFLMKKK